ncbi:MAG: hypothetical protein LRY30_00010 [Gammaproteobacteria bacterium]|nr:hypothetical protein [Gammaproteobacteria bacterium]
MAGTNAAKPTYTFVTIGLDVERALLRERIAQRFYQMLDNGFMTEVERLYKTPELHNNLPAIKISGVCASVGILRRENQL